MWSFLGFKATSEGHRKAADCVGQPEPMLPNNFFPAQPSPQQMGQQQNVTNGGADYLFGDPWMPTNAADQQTQQHLLGQPNFFVPPVQHPLQVITIALQYGPLKELVVVERTSDQAAFELFR